LILNLILVAAVVPLAAAVAEVALVFFYRYNI
jgi:hypothetical protein